jgi:hypothetical protein
MPKSTQCVRCSLIGLIADAVMLTFLFRSRDKGRSRSWWCGEQPLTERPVSRWAPSGAAVDTTIRANRAILHMLSSLRLVC